MQCKSENSVRISFPPVLQSEKICPFTQSIVYKTEPDIKKSKKNLKKYVRQVQIRESEDLERHIGIVNA